jgi:hypothetical protein
MRWRSQCGALASPAIGSDTWMPESTPELNVPAALGSNTLMASVCGRSLG